ncbi:hypothetical protein E2C01_100869 [Portunus trituberculatus]|uniref:Uncharacterized protein n=1 Tax=Portunus trituberculatus TaxID=210409 RepID=A0A5B7KJ04_PORTR|nr:hypothetical protein [Portunus trituberculatus]
MTAMVRAGCSKQRIGIWKAGQRRCGPKNVASMSSVSKVPSQLAVKVGMGLQMDSHWSY